MELLYWTGIYLIITALIGFYLLIKKGIENKSLQDILFSISLLPLLFINLLHVLNIEWGSIDIIERWSHLTSLLFVYSGLLEFIRVSKPKFSKFPIYLIFVPFITLALYPLAVETKVISNMLVLTYEAGAIIVGLLLFGIHHVKSKNKLYELMSLLIFMGAYIFYWFLPDIEIFNTKLYSKLLLGAAILIFSTGTKTNMNND